MNQRRASSRRGLVTVVVLGLLAQGCASTYWRLGFKDEFEGVDSVGGELVPIPMEPYPYFRGTVFDATSSRSSSSPRLPSSIYR